jgi:hypothetical protein
MSLIKMSSAMLIDTPMLNRWDKGRIAPGPVGSVGDALTAVRIKQTDPDMPVKFDKTFSGSNAPKRGSNVQDGSYASYSDGGFNAEVVTRKRQKKSNVGTFMQQLSGNDRTFDAVMIPQPRAGFITQAEAILHRQGDKFQILPGGYGPEPGQLLRGGQIPRVVYNEGVPVGKGVNGGGESSVVLPEYPEALPDTLVGPTYPPWVENRPSRPGLRIDTSGMKMGLGNQLSGMIAGMDPFARRKLHSPNSVISGYDSAPVGSQRPPVPAGGARSASARLASGQLLTPPDLMREASSTGSSPMYASLADKYPSLYPEKVSPTYRSPIGPKLPSLNAGWGRDRFGENSYDSSKGEKPFRGDKAYTIINKL